MKAPLLTATVTENSKVGPRHFFMRMAVSGFGSAVPGQFLMVRVQDSPAPLLRRPFGVHGCGRDEVSILYEAVGDATRILSVRRPGDRLGVIGPLGKGFRVPRVSAGRPVLVAGGMGIAPLFFLAQALVGKKAGKKPLVLLGARSGDCLLKARELRRLGCEVRTATDDGSKGFHGYVTRLLERALDKERLDIYGCGPAPMLKELCRISGERGLTAQVSLEAHMSCGFGACLGCVVRTVSGYQRVCKEGPVFDAGEVLWARE